MAYPYPIAVTNVSEDAGRAIERTILRIDPDAVQVVPQSSFVYD